MSENEMTAPTQAPLIIHFVTDDAAETAARQLCSLTNQANAAPHQQAGGARSRNFRHMIVRLSQASSIRTTDSPPKSDGIETHYIQSAAQSGGRLDWCSFELDEILEPGCLLHIHNPFTAAGEAAFALGKNKGILCILDCEASEQPDSEQSRPAWKWGMAQLADAITCNSEQRFQQLQRDAGSSVFRISADTNRSTESSRERDGESSRESNKDREAESSQESSKRRASESDQENAKEIGNSRGAQLIKIYANLIERIDGISSIGKGV